MKSPVAVKNRRRILCVFPRDAPSFGMFEHADELMDGVRAFRPPQGLIATAFVAHHMISFARECTIGWQNAAFYADRPAPKLALRRTA